MKGSSFSLPRRSKLGKLPYKLFCDFVVPRIASFKDSPYLGLHLLIAALGAFSEIFVASTLDSNFWFALINSSGMITFPSSFLILENKKSVKQIANMF